MIGTVQLRYRILGKLGEGAMGEVYLAEHLALGRKEALKILHARLAGDPQFVQRFRREARATNRVQHPNIVSVYDFGQLPDRRFFLAMEYVAGERLDAALGRLGVLPVRRTLHILGQLADALDHAHERGVVHRDLKPANLLLVEHRGHVDTLKVLDFGIAKIIAPEYLESAVLSREGDVFGTPAYIAPEQWRAAPAHPSFDLYALGCIAYEMLTGGPPFVGRRMELMHAHLTEAAVPPGRRRAGAGVPPQLDAVVLRCLEKDPARRFASGRELRHALEAVPGFAEARAAGGRPRSAASDFEPGDTFTDAGRTAPVADDLTSAPTELLGGGVEAARAALREGAEAVLDHGAGDLALTLALARVKELDDERARADAKLAALEAEAGTLEQVAREREGALRFAVAELSFERDQALARGESVELDLENELAALQRRLAAVSRELVQDLEGVTDRQVAVTAARARTIEALDASCVALERLVLPALERRAGDRALSPHLARLGALRGGATGRR